MPVPVVNVRSSVVARRSDGQLVVALFDVLPAPLESLTGSVVVFECSPETASALAGQLQRGSVGETWVYE